MGKERAYTQKTPSRHLSKWEMVVSKSRYERLISFIWYSTTKRDREVVMSVYAKAMAQKAMEQKQNNFKETGIYETNIQRKKREK